MENSPKLVVAALHGTPLGGGLETALGAHYRVALPHHAPRPARSPSRPAAGRRRHQRLPRLTGAKYALDAILSGRHIPAPEAKNKGIVDALVEGDDLLKGAIAHTEMLLAQKAPRRRIRDLSVTLESPDLFAETEKAIARKARGFKAPWNIIKCVQAAVELPFDEGMNARARAVRRTPDLVGVAPHSVTTSSPSARRPRCSTCRPTRRSARSRPAASSAPARWAAASP